MIKLLILFFLPLSVGAKTAYKPVKALPLAEVVWTEGTRYKLNKALSDGKIQLSLTPKVGPKWINQIPRFCKKEKLECQLFPSASKSEYFNIYVVGNKDKINEFIKFLKQNSLKTNY